MATKNNFSKAVMDLMGLPSTEDSAGIDKQEDTQDAYFDNGSIERDNEIKKESEFEIERKKFLYNAKNVTTSPVVPVQEENSATVISRTMVIVGEITSSNNIDVYGDVKGSIKTSGDIKITGKIIGNLAGSNLTLNGCTVQGNISAQGDVVIGQNAVIVGDIMAENIKINGKVKGNLKINKMSEFMENALLAGDVQSQTISMNQGAKLHGNVSIALDSTQSEKEFDSILGV